MDCYFCKLINDNNNNYFVKELKFGKLYLHENQSYLGRCYYIWKSHVDDFTILPPSDFAEATIEVQSIATILKTVLNSPRINIAILGNQISHLHWHIIPRYLDDERWGNPPWPNTPKRFANDFYLQLANKIANAL